MIANTTEVFSRRIINLTRELPVQNQYTLALDNEYRNCAFNEERAPGLKGHWRHLAFLANDEMPMDLEIGTGSGYFFNHQCLNNPHRLLVGIEIKYKPLIQTIRRAKNSGAVNAVVCRFHAFNLDQLFTKNELNNIYIHFPDPWVTPKKPRNRLVQKSNLDVFFELQKSGSFLEFKTDSLLYFDWAMDEIKKTSYDIEFMTHDLHHSEMAKENFVTGFESIFLRQGMKINYVRLRKP